MTLAQARTVGVVLFFVTLGPVWADDEQLRKALDQLSTSYVTAQRSLQNRDAAVKALTESLAIARTESEMFQKLWMEAQVRAQTLGANITEPDNAATQRQLVETLRTLYLAEADRQRLINQLRYELWAQALRPESWAGFTSPTTPDTKPEKLQPLLASATFYAMN